MVIRCAKLYNVGVGILNEVALMNEDVPDCRELLKDFLLAGRQRGQIRQRILEVR